MTFAIKALDYYKGDSLTSCFFFCAHTNYEDDDENAAPGQAVLAHCKLSRPQLSYAHLFTTTMLLFYIFSDRERSVLHRVILDEHHFRVSFVSVRNECTSWYQQYIWRIQWRRS